MEMLRGELKNLETEINAHKESDFDTVKSEDIT